jgi:hypothetical protein
MSEALAALLQEIGFNAEVVPGKLQNCVPARP